MHYKILRRYTLALYGTAEETKKLDEVNKDAAFIISMLNPFHFNVHANLGSDMQ